MRPASGLPRRGMPLAMIALVLAAWVGARTVLWESPWAEVAAPGSGPIVAVRGVAAGGSPPPALAAASQGTAPATAQPPPSARLPGSSERLALLGSGRTFGSMDPRLAAAHQGLLRAAMGIRLAPPAAAGVTSAGGDPSAPAEVPAFLPERASRPGKRLSLDAWLFVRQGSDAAPISQGRVPIYGASQAGAVVQYRLAPASRRDPRLYARGYRALVRRGESELALGASVRPLPALPLRALGELRVTDGAFRSELRPSAFAITEIAPVALPLDTRLETYAQGGWVGGTDATLFADGQASITREVSALAAATDRALRLSLGAGAWGGAQEGAHRLDIGPTMRLDLKLGEVPARVSVDWRERVEGDAGPETGLAVTLSTGF